MEAYQLLTADYLDIIFDNRNKSYGGYELRKHYRQRMQKALATIILLCSLASAYLILSAEVVVPTVIPTFTPTELKDLTPFVPPPPPAAVIQPPPSDAATVDNVKPVIVKDELIREPEMPAQDELSSKKIGTEHIAGLITDTDLGGPGGTISTGGTGVITTPMHTTAAVRYVQQMPEFDGDLRAYLARNLKYPEIAREHNIEGKVTVEFIVNEDGSVQNAIVKRGIGGGCDEEALRVIKSMPLWKAGKQNGKAVKVYLLLPIVFKLQ